MFKNRPEPSALTGYALNPLDRFSAKRDDPAYLAELMAAPDTRWFVIGKDRPALKIAPGGPEALFTGDEVAALGRIRDTVLLGRDDNHTYFAGLLDDGVIVAREAADEGAFIETNQLVIPSRPDILLKDLRAIVMEGALPANQIGALGQAKSLLHWHARHRFCSMCGARTESASAGYRRDCKACGSQHFPRTDPVVIMLAVYGDECLLGRQPRFNKGALQLRQFARLVSGGHQLWHAIHFKEGIFIAIGRKKDLTKLRLPGLHTALDFRHFQE
jgi:NAD+ diphosphatase